MPDKVAQAVVRDGRVLLALAQARCYACVCHKRKKTRCKCVVARYGCGG